MPVQWYFANSTAKTYRGIQAFCSSNWDYAGVTESYAIGESRGTPRTYSKGQNVWGYTGQCTVGESAAFRDGEVPARLANVPGCCRPPSGLALYLRSDLKPVGQPVPGVFLLGWDNQGAPTTAALLSPAIGNATQVTPVSYFANTQQPSSKIGVKQYLSVATGPMLLFPRDWTFSIGWGVSAILHAGVTPYFGVCLVDGTSLEVLNTIIDLQFAAPSSINPETPRGWITREPIDVIQIQAGQFLCVEIGYSRSDVSTGVHSFTAAFRDAGPDPIVTSGAPNAQPASLLDFFSL